MRNTCMRRYVYDMRERAMAADTRVEPRCSGGEGLEGSPGEACKP